jgi:hypothetical protein
MSIVKNKYKAKIKHKEENIPVKDNNSLFYILMRAI